MKYKLKYKFVCGECGDDITVPARAYFSEYSQEWELTEVFPIDLTEDIECGCENTKLVIRLAEEGEENG